MVKFPASSTVSGNSVSLLGPGMALNIEALLNRIPEAQRRQELRQVSMAQIVQDFVMVQDLENY